MKILTCFETSIDYEKLTGGIDESLDTSLMPPILKQSDEVAIATTLYIKNQLNLFNENAVCTSMMFASSNATSILKNQAALGYDELIHLHIKQNNIPPLSYHFRNMAQQVKDYITKNNFDIIFLAKDSSQFGFTMAELIGYRVIDRVVDVQPSPCLKELIITFLQDDIRRTIQLALPIIIIMDSMATFTSIAKPTLMQKEAAANKEIQKLDLLENNDDFSNVVLKYGSQRTTKAITDDTFSKIVHELKQKGILDA